jgi:uncharacterized membrane protein YfcA
MADAGLYAIAAMSLFAATVNGGLGYGYSSLTVPVALLFVVGRVLNPAIVLVEVAVNLFALFLGRRSIAAVWPRVSTMVLGLVPGVALGSLLLSEIAPSWVKLGTFGVLLPLILIQAGGLSWPIRRERLAGAPLGMGVGLLYSLTTISGPPLALFFNNQKFDRSDFKVGLAIVRTAEALFTLVAYASLGMFTRSSTGMLVWIVPGVLIGMPIGHWLVRRVDPATFRRVCLTFDVWLVSFGIARVLTSLSVVPAVWAYQVMTCAILLDAFLLHGFFAVTRGRQSSHSIEPGRTHSPSPIVATS